MRSRDLQEVSEEGKFVIDFKNGDSTSQAVSLFSTGQIESAWVWLCWRDDLRDDLSCCVIYFSCCRDRYLTKNNLRKKGFVWTYGLSVQSIMVREAGKQEPEESGRSPAFPAWLLARPLMLTA